MATSVARVILILSQQGTQASKIERGNTIMPAREPMAICAFEHFSDFFARSADIRFS